MNNPYIKTLEPFWRSFNHISVNEAKLKKLIENMRKKQESGELATPAWAEQNIEPPIDCSLIEWIDFVCWTSTINFAFTNFTPPYNKFIVEYPSGTQHRGALALKASFMRAQKEGFPIFSASYLAEISLKEAEHIFRSVGYNCSMPMLTERWKILREVANVLIKKYNGSWPELFKIGNWRAFNSGIVDRLVADFPSFKDERVYIFREERILKRHVLEFHKRAQLLAMVYQGRALHSKGGFPLIDDINDLGPICDYEVPKALALPDVGVLEYSKVMEKLILKHHVFFPGHLMEIENRLATAYIMKKICDEAGINMVQAHYYFWEMGRKSKEPHILVPTTDY